MSGLVAEEGGELPRQLVDWGTLPDQAVLNGELRAALDQAIATLPETLRVVFVLREHRGAVQPRRRRKP